MKRRSFLATAAAVPALAQTQQTMKGQLKITGLETDLIRLPPGKPYSDAIHMFGQDRGGVALRILTNAGITGWGYSHSV